MLETLRKKYLPKDGLTHFDAEKALSEVTMDPNEDPVDYLERLLTVQYQFEDDIHERQLLKQFLSGCNAKYKTSILQIYRANPKVSTSDFAEKLQIDYRLSEALDSSLLIDQDTIKHETVLAQVGSTRPPPRNFPPRVISTVDPSNKTCFLCENKGHLTHQCQLNGSDSHSGTAVTDQDFLNIGYPSICAFAGKSLAFGEPRLPKDAEQRSFNHLYIEECIMKYERQNMISDQGRWEEVSMFDPLYRQTMTSLTPTYANLLQHALDTGLDADAVDVFTYVSEIEEESDVEEPEDHDQSDSASENSSSHTSSVGTADSPETSLLLVVCTMAHLRSALYWILDTGASTHSSLHKLSAIKNRKVVSKEFLANNGSAMRIHSRSDASGTLYSKDNIPVSEIVLKKNAADRQQVDERQELSLVGATGTASTHTTDLHVKKLKGALASPQRDQWMEAIEDEFDRFEKHGVFQVVPAAAMPMDYKALSSVWTLKRKANGIFRARLTMRGYEQIPGLHYSPAWTSGSGY